MDRETASIFAALLVRDWRKTYGRETNCRLYAPSGSYDSRRISDADIVRYQISKFKAHPAYFWFWLRRVSAWCGHDNRYRAFVDAAARWMRETYPDITPLEIPA